MVVFVTLFATNFIEVQQCKKRVSFCWIFVGGSFFNGNELTQINEKSSKFAIIRSHVSFNPHSYFKNSIFFSQSQSQHNLTLFKRKSSKKSKN